MSRDELTATAEDTGPVSKTDVPELARYRIERKLGEGGMGVVYEAFDLELQRRVALKVIRAGLSDQSNQRMLREARAMARLQHPNVVTIYDVTSANGRDYISMELVDGEPLNEWLRTPRSEAEVLDAFLQAGRGLAAAHGKGIVHRDFKPHNILRSGDGRIAVTDFGLARDAADPMAVTAPPGTLSLDGLTVPGARVGTPAYMAPEQWSGGRISLATDQFAFCVALWEAFAGERPFRGDTVEALREQVDRGARELNASKLPRRVRPVVIRGLERDPDKRWSSMPALLARLAPRKRWPFVVIGLSLVSIAIGLVLVLRGGDRTEEWEALVSEAKVAREDNRFDDAIARYRKALELGISTDETSLELGKTLYARRQRGDLEQMRAVLASSSLPEAEWLDASAAWAQGEPTAVERLLRFHKAEIQGRLQWGTQWSHGTVVLPDGTPADGAKVAVGPLVIGDPKHVAMTLWEPSGFGAAIRVTETARGMFNVLGRPPNANVVAQLGALRSRSQPLVEGMTVKLEQTFSIRGRVERGGRNDIVFATAALIETPTASIATPLPDSGRFVLEGLVSGPTVVGISFGDSESALSGFVIQQVIDPATARDELVFELPATRSINVRVHGLTTNDLLTAAEVGIGGAVVYIGAGTFDVTGDRRPLMLRPQISAQVTRLGGGNWARFRRAPIGEATVCVEVLGRGTPEKLMTCKPVPPNAETVEIEL